MTQRAAYDIRHVQLADTVALPPLPASAGGEYLVFWWQQIPVGQLFVEPGESLTAARLVQKITAAVQPVIDAGYPAGSAPPPAGTIGSLQHLSKVLAQRLRAYNVPTLPARVPITVVICTRNRAAQLQDALRSLRALPCQPDEIIVIDNAPTDDSTVQVVARHADVVYCREPRAGLDIARNTGVRTARMPVVAFIDDDVRVHPHWAYQVWQTFDQTDAAAMTGLVIAAELQTEAQVVFEKHWSFNRGYTDKVYDTAYFDRHLPSGPPVWEIGAGANMAFRRQCFEQTGLFDERLDVGAAGCNGDSEMWFRILAQGYTIRYNPQAVAYHEHRRAFSALKKQLFSYMRGHTVAALVQHRHHRRASYKRYLLQALPFYYLLLLKAGFPAYRFRYKTLGAEVRGILSGLLFYVRNRKPIPRATTS